MGSGIKQPLLEGLARNLGVMDRVRFLTGVPDADLPALYNCAEIYLGLSRPAELLIEGFGISLSEASACGIPVVGGMAGGIPDAVRDGETGILVDSTDLHAVVDVVRSLLTDGALRRRPGRGQRRSAPSVRSKRTTSTTACRWVDPTRMPVSPSRTASGIPPAIPPTTGIPQADASDSEIPILH